MSTGSSSGSGPPYPTGGVVPRQRRFGGGARHEASERVVIRGKDFETTGWTLNVSRGGVRVVLEDPVDFQAEYEIVMADQTARRARVVWTRDEADGQIAGVQFLDVEGSVPPPPTDAPPGSK